MQFAKGILFAGVVVCLVAEVSGLAMALAAEPKSAESRSLDQWLSAIDADYGQAGWGQQHRRRPDGYMRNLGDPGWKTRMLALHAAVVSGPDSIGPLVQALESGTPPQRIFAAQALGFLGADAPLEPLLKAAQSDDDPCVRLHAVDSLGRRGDSNTTVDWQSLRTKESSDDVRTHIAYAVERGEQGFGADELAKLRAWDPATIDTAVVGQQAPDFELASATGETIRLSDFRGKHPVVLVFVYGDTCPVCHRHLAELRRGLDQLKDLDAVLLAVDPHEIWAAKALLRETGLSTDDLQYPLLLDPTLTTSAAYGVAMQERIHTDVSDRPATFVIDRDGVLCYARRAETIPDRPTANEVVAELQKL
jgi:peroxiredoxin